MNLIESIKLEIRQGLETIESDIAFHEMNDYHLVFFNPQCEMVLAICLDKLLLSLSDCEILQFISQALTELEREGCFKRYPLEVVPLNEDEEDLLEFEMDRYDDYEDVMLAYPFMEWLNQEDDSLEDESFTPL